MEYLYILSNIFLIVTAILVKKKDDKINFLSTFIIIITLYLCYNSVTAYLLNTINIPINLVSMFIVNMAISILIWIIQWIKIKNIEVQKYYIKKKDIVVWIMLLIINVPILYKEFGLFDNFRFISTDATMHAIAAMRFSESHELLSQVDGIQAINPTFLIGGYVNLGMLFQTFSPIIGEFQIYRLYIIFDVSIYLLTGLLFYHLLEKYVNKSKSKEIIAIILTLIYMLGYPLNSLITGFHYFAIGILQLLAIVYVLREYGKTRTIPAIFLLNSGLLLTYNLFAPMIYIVELIAILIHHKKEEGKLISKKVIKNVIIGMGIPGIIGISFFIIPRIVQDIELGSSQNLNVDGYIYINYITNLLIFIPFAVYETYRQVGKKAYTVEMVAFWTMALYTVMFELGNSLGIISTYYYMKNYYVLMPFTLLMFYQGACILIEKGKIGKIITLALIGGYVVCIFCNLIFIKVDPYKFTRNPDSSIVDIYNSNKSIMEYIQELFPKERLDALEYLYENNCIDGQNVLLISNHIDEHLLQFFFNYQNRKNLELKNIEEEIGEWNNKNYEYLIVFNKDYYLERYQEIEPGETVFENEYSVIYKW